MYKQGQARGNALLWIGIIVVAVLVFKPDLLSGLGLGTSAAPAVPGAPASTPGVIQTAVDEVTVTLNTWDKLTKNTEIGNGSHRVFLNDVDKGWFADGGSFKASPGDNLVVYFGLNSTSNYPVKKTYTVAQTKGTLEASAGLLAIDSTLTLTGFDKNGAVISATNTQALTNNDVQSVKVRATASSKTGFGDVDLPGKGNIVCLQGNLTSYDSLKIDGAAKAYQPQAQTSSTGNSVWCYYWAPIQDDPAVSGDGEWEAVMSIDVKDVNPTGANSNITINFYDSGFDLNADSLVEIMEVEDESGNDLGTGAGQQLVYGVS